uniref:Uncharacterized protein n=1 Tax=Plectus sambesii TaxID=2011161 RepID=A0A914VX54_9BILA
MSDSSSGDDASFCSNCAQVHEVFSRPTNGSGLDLSFGVELSREDAMDVIDYFKGLAEQNRICRCLFATRERFWILHRTVVETMMVLCRAENSMDISTSSSIRSDDGSSIEQQQRLELAIFVQNALNDAFPLYQIYRRDPSLHDPSDKLDRDTLKFADKHPHISYALCRTIRLLMDASFLERLADLFSDCDREAISPKLAHAILLCVVPLRFMLAVKYRRHTEGPFEHCAEMFIEMVKNDQEIVRNHSFRVSVDLIWRFAIEDMDDSDAIDKASLRLAAAHLESPYLSPKINGMTHISEVVRAFTDITTGDVCEADGESSSLRLQTSMAEHLQKLKIVSRVFELSGHPELIKQCFTVMEFMARYGTLTVADLDAVWAAAQKKECTRHVFDLLSTIVKHLEPALILYMHSLLRAMKPNEHNELSLNLSLHCAEMIWRLGIIKAQYIRGFGSNQMNATSETATERIIVGSSGAPSEAGTSISGDSNEVANVSSNQPVGGRAPGESSLPRPTCGSNANDPLNATFSADDDDWTSRSIIREKLLANQSLTPQSKPFDAIGKRPSDEKIGGGAGASKKVRLGSSGDSPSPLVLSPIRPIYDAPVLMYHRPSSPNKIPLHGPEIDQHRILLDRLKTGQHVGNRSQRPQLAHDGEETSDSDEDVSSDRATSRSHSMAGLDDDDLDELRNSSHSPPAHVEHIDNDSIPPRYPSVLRPHPSVASASRSQPINSIYVHTYRVICESVNFPLFQVDKVCQPGNTLLWDLMCDETE